MVAWILRRGEFAILEVGMERGEESSRGFGCCVVPMKETSQP